MRRHRQKAIAHYGDGCGECGAGPTLDNFLPGVAKMPEREEVATP
jgi:hypothetical protein